MPQRPHAATNGVLLVHSVTAPSWDMTCASVDFRGFSADFLRARRPDEVRCWLFCAEYDAIDIAIVLAEVQFSGILRTRSRPMPQGAMIRREIRRACAGLRLRLDMVPPVGDAHHAYEAEITFPGPTSDVAPLARRA